MKALVLLLVVAAAAVTSGSDLKAQQSSPVVTRIPAAKPEDVNTIDGIITALYASISGPKGQPRDWARLRSLMIPEARLMPTTARQPSGRGLAILSIGDYIAVVEKSLTEMGFREREVARRVEEFGSIAHAFSTYDSYRGDETTPFMRGINTIQLFNDGTRWWVVSVMWDAERPGLTIPDKYLRP